jgi:hypothetical protein
VNAPPFPVPPPAPVVKETAPPAPVVLPVPPVTVRALTAATPAVPEFCPVMCSDALGAEVPIPTYPEFFATVKIGEEVPTENNEFPAGVVEPIERDPANVDVAVVDVEIKLSATTFPATASFAYGEVEPIPRRLLVLSQKKLSSPD